VNLWLIASNQPLRHLLGSGICVGLASTAVKGKELILTFGLFRLDFFGSRPLRFISVHLRDAFQ
jgi:hypothetical protein